MYHSVQVMWHLATIYEMIASTYNGYLLAPSVARFVSVQSPARLSLLTIGLYFQSYPGQPASLRLL